MIAKSPAQKHPPITVLHGLLVFLINSGGQIPSTLPFGLNRLPRRVTLECFVAAFETLQYARCESEEYEDGFEKIAILVDPFTTKPTHAARQLTTGRWTSKLGHSFDIEHDLRGGCGQIYGTVGAIMKRVLTDHH